MLTSKRFLAIGGLIAGLLLVIVSVGAVIAHYYVSAPASGQTTTTDPCRAGLSPQTLYRTALGSQRPGQWDRAIACARQISATHPGYKQALFVEAWALWNTGRRSAAIDVYRTYLRFHPEDAQGWLNLGYSLTVTNDCKEAIPALNAVLRLQTANIAAVHDLVVCGDLDDAYVAALHEQSVHGFAAALAQVREITTTHPDFRNILFLEAWAQWNLGQRERAIATYRGYLKSHPTDAQAQLNLGVALIDVGRCAEAIAVLQDVVKLEPKNSAAVYDLALCRVKASTRPAAGTQAPVARHTAAKATPTAHH